MFPREGGGPGISNDSAPGSWPPASAGEQGAGKQATTLPADGRLPGVTASPGIAIGQAGLFRLAEIAVAVGVGESLVQALTSRGWTAYL